MQKSSRVPAACGVGWLRSAASETHRVACIALLASLVLGDA
jgi:hypothetical protein